MATNNISCGLLEISNEKKFSTCFVLLSRLISLMDILTKGNENHKLSVLLKTKTIFVKDTNKNLRDRYDSI